jgi:hypothetical protein
MRRWQSLAYIAHGLWPEDTGEVWSDKASTARLTIQEKDLRMTVTHQRIGAKLTERLITRVSAPWDEETLGVLHSMFKASSETSTFEGIAAFWEAFYQDVLAQAKLPPWNKYVRIYANGAWADDLPEDWHQRPHEVLKPGEGIGRAINIVEQRDGTDSPAWFAAKILDGIDLVRMVIARGEAATVAHLTVNLTIDVAIATLKSAWEADAWLGKNHRQASSKGGKGKGQSTGEEHVKWQQRANTILDAHPSMPWSRVYKQVAAEFNKSTSDVRKYIRNPTR